MSGCSGCDIRVCPASEGNTEVVDKIIENHLEGVDIDSVEEIKKAKREIALEVISEGMKPCAVCLKVNLRLEELRTKTKEAVTILSNLEKGEWIQNQRKY